MHIPIYILLMYIPLILYPTSTPVCRYASRLYKAYENIHQRFSTTSALKRDNKFIVIHYAGNA